MDVMHGFELTTDEAGVEMLSGQPNLVAGDYMWVLNARDSASDQHAYRSWKLNVMQELYPPTAQRRDANNGTEPVASND